MTCSGRATRNANMNTSDLLSHWVIAQEEGKEREEEECEEGGEGDED